MTFQEMEHGFQEVRDLFVETHKELKALFQETADRFKETDLKFKETDKKIGELTGKWGRFVEGLIAPAAVRLFTERGIAVDSVSQRVKKRKNGDSLEIDVLATDDEYVVLIEVKSTLGVEDIKEHLEQLAKFTAFFPEYKDRKVVGAVAGIVIDEGADKFAYRHGLFVIAQSGETVKILNDEKFTPKVW